MTGDEIGDPSATFARWCRIDEGPSTEDDRVAERWRIAFNDEREFWRALDTAPADPQPDVTVDQLTAALDGKDILVSVGTGVETRNPVRPHDLAVQLLEAVDAQRAAAGLEVAKRVERGPRASVVEIVERNHATTDSLAGSVIVPNEVRINGVPVLTTGDITVSGTPRESEFTVNLTLTARKVTVAAEGDL